MTSCILCGHGFVAKPICQKSILSSTRELNRFRYTKFMKPICCGIRASMVDSDSYESSSNFVKRMEQAWLISQVCSFFLFSFFFSFLKDIFPCNVKKNFKI